MKEDGVPPTQVAYNTAIGACAFFGRPSKLSTGEFFFVSRLAAEAARAEAERGLLAGGRLGASFFSVWPRKGFRVFVGCGVAHVSCFFLLLDESHEKRPLTLKRRTKASSG